MALELVKLDSTTLPGIADAIRAKTGETALLLPSQMAAAIGGIKNLRVETGTITPAEDTTTITIPCSNNAKYAVVSTTSETYNTYDILGAIISNNGENDLFLGNCVVTYYHSSRVRFTVTNAALDVGINIPQIDSSFYYRGGASYTWVAYYWEDA